MKGHAMSKRRGLILLLALFGLSLLGVASWSSAQRTPSGTATANSDAVVADDVLTAGETVQVTATVKGDVAAAGADVTIAGPVQGYVMGAGRHVRIDGPVGNDVWAAGETVEVHNTVGNNAMLAGRLVHLETGAVIGEDARLAGSEVVLDGRVRRNLRIGADRAVIRGTVGGNVEARADRLTVEPGAVIQGDLTVRSPRPPEVSPGAQVTGEVRYEQMNDSWMAWTWPLRWLVMFLALLLLGTAITVLSPARTRRVAATLRARFGRSLLVGVLAIALIPIGIVILAVTVIGLPLAAVLTAMYVLLLALSGVFVSYRVGEWLLDLAHGTSASPWARMALGALVLSLAVSAPFVGAVIGIAVVLAGAGAFALEEREFRAQLRGAGLA
jgi:cytoskeletal protein CcmA (bactofilin family)